jgi:hypothetical protein
MAGGPTCGRSAIIPAISVGHFFHRSGPFSAVAVHMVPIAYSSSTRLPTSAKKHIISQIPKVGLTFLEFPSVSNDFIEQLVESCGNSPICENEFVILPQVSLVSFRRCRQHHVSMILLKFMIISALFY